MNINEIIGGIEFKHVIIFQTQVMMGSQFKRIKNANNGDDIVIACLRLGWNDAFRHTSENIKQGDKTVLDVRSADWNKGHNEPDDYICSILKQEPILEIFKNYAKAKTVNEKVAAVINRFEELKDIFGQVKKLDGNRQLCFGHFQKMFNIAIKLYLCLYMCRGFLEIDDNLFCNEIIENLKKADCPVDSIILDRLKEKTSNKEYGNYKWSKFGTNEHSTNEYIAVQEEISKLKDVQGKSNLYYDFIAWER